MSSPCDRGTRRVAAPSAQVGEALPARHRRRRDARRAPGGVESVRWPRRRGRASASSHTSARASECSRMNRSSGAASRQLIGIAIAPRWLAAKIVARNSMLLYESSPTTSPAPTPRACRPPRERGRPVVHALVGDDVVAEAPRAACRACGAAWCSSTPTQLMSGCIGCRHLLTARRSRRRPRSPSPWSSARRRSRGTSTRPPGRRRRRGRAGAWPRSRRSPPAGSSSWMPERNVPGHTQLTRMPSRAYSTAATFASWITAAFVAQYGAACDHAVSPATDAVRMIEPDCCGRMTAHRGA